MDHPGTAAVAARERGQTSSAAGTGRKGTMSVSAALRRGRRMANRLPRPVGQTRMRAAATVGTPPPTRQTWQSLPEVPNGTRGGRVSSEYGRQSAIPYRYWRLQSLHRSSERLCLLRGCPNDYYGRERPRSKPSAWGHSNSPRTQMARR